MTDIYAGQISKTDATAGRHEVAPPDTGQGAAQVAANPALLGFRCSSSARSRRGST